MGDCDWFAISIHDPRSRPKSVRTLKNTMKFQSLAADVNPLWLEQIVSCGVFFLVFQTNYLDIQSFKIFQNIPNNSSARK